MDIWQILEVGVFFSIISGLTGIGIGYSLGWESAWNDGYDTAKRIFDHEHVWQ